MFNKLKKIIINIRTIIIVLVVLTIIGWALTVYFGIKAGNKKDICGSYDEKVQKLNYYALLLDKSVKLIRENKGLDVLEEDIRLLDNGVLLAEWENVVFGGNQKKDTDNYLDVIIDSLKFFSE